VSEPGTNSLRSQLIRRLLPLQAGLLAVFTLLLVGTLWASGFLLHHRDERRVIEVLRTRSPSIRPVQSHCEALRICGGFGQMHPISGS